MPFLSQKSRWLILLVAIALGLLGFWFVPRAILNTEYPVLPITSGYMCLSELDCDGFSHPFEPTLHVGDLIIIQGTNAESIVAAYPDSDILVFHFPQEDPTENGGLIIRRVVAKEERDGVIYFRTKNDGEGAHKWPEIPEVSECDRWHDIRENYTLNGMISEKLLVGKIVFRIPWIGHIAVFVQTYGIFLVVIPIAIISIVKFAVPKFTHRKAKTESKKNVEEAFET